MSSQTSPHFETTTTPQKLGVYPLTGGCPCSHVRYTLSSAPLIVHACHCTYCHRESGSAFALNAIYEPNRLALTLSTGETGAAADAKLLRKGVPTAHSGPEGQVLARCPECYATLFSTYAAGGPLVIVRVGTLDGVVDGDGRYVAGGGLVPDAHIFAGDGEERSNRFRWFGIPEGSVVYEGYGPREEYWPKESLERIGEFLRESRGTGFAL
ncbi:hypothetical protein IQ07DRAFT_634925 [Pyrenochaeta sp. DS3sAY3a]|nr:hypothetical protein IQ07DRAFT_634925 [Pyrenochaeta sp. DS3sAY3a]